MSAIRGTVQQHRGGILRTFTKAVGLSSRISRASKAGSASGAEPTFGYDSPECQLRLLGDMYFMIGQYQDAEGCYSDAASEFKSQKAIRHWGAALEALALSRFMQMPAQGSMGMELWRYASMLRSCVRRHLLYRSCWSSLHAEAVPFVMDDLTGCNCDSGQWTTLSGHMQAFSRPLPAVHQGLPS